MERAIFTNDISPVNLPLKKVFIFLLTLKIVTCNDNQRSINNKTTNHSCFVCDEPLVGYTDHAGSCRFFNAASPMAAAFIGECNNDDYTGEYECRKLVISFRSVETYLRRDCVPKGLCSWKDKTQSMINTPVSNCVYTDVEEEKLECIYCCDTPLCNRTMPCHMTIPLISWLLFIHWWRRRTYI